MVPDKQKFRRKVLLGLASSKLTLYPLVTGLSLLAGVWALGGNNVGLFSGIALVLWSCGKFVTDLLGGSEKVASAAVEELRQEYIKERNAYLDALEERLVKESHHDPRDEEYLRELRRLAGSFLSGGLWSRGVSATISLELTGCVEELLNGCVRTLEHSLEFLRMANDISTASARKSVLAQRETLLKEVGESIDKLQGVLAGMQTIGAGNVNGTDDLAKTREALDRYLWAARDSDARIKAMDQEIADIVRSDAGDRSTKKPGKAMRQGDK